MENTTTTITPDAKELFTRYWKDGGNWGGTPMVGCDGNVRPVLGEREDRGLLTSLKRAGLVTTFKSDGIMWLNFTESAPAFAAALGLGEARW